MENGYTYEVSDVYEKSFGDVCRIRAIMIDGDEWYFAVDVADIFNVYAQSIYTSIRNRKTIHVGYRKNIVIDLDGLIAYCKKKAHVSSTAEKLLKILESLTMEVKTDEENPMEENNSVDSGLVLFHSEEFPQLRMLEIDGEPWFVGKDVAEALGYVNSRKAIADHVDEEDKKDGVTIRDSIGREQNPILINESGMYALILSSKLESAKKFKRWVTSEVLPSIRKSGTYGKDSRVEELIKNQYEFIEATKVLTEQMILLSDRVSSLETEKKTETVAVEEPLPFKKVPLKKTYKEVMDEREYPVNITTIAKDFGHEPAELNFILCKAGIQYKYGKSYFPTDLYADQGIMKEITYKDKAKGDVVTYTRWTREGNDLIREKVMNELGWFPLCEVI